LKTKQLPRFDIDDLDSNLFHELSFQRYYNHVQRNPHDWGILVGHLYNDYNVIPYSVQYEWSLVLLLMNNRQVFEIHEQEMIHFEIIILR